MWSPVNIPVISNPSVVGFAEAEMIGADVAADLRRRLGDAVDGAPVPDQVLLDLVPLMVAAVDAANSLHFRFDLDSLGGDEAPFVLRAAGPSSIAGLDADHSNRKLVVVLPLEGAASIALPSVAKERRLHTGTVAIFPAFLANSILPERHGLVAVVAYAAGPSFV